MKHQTSRDLFAYWNTLRGDRAAPERRDIDPAAIRKLLADTLMVEVKADGLEQPTFSIRLSGTRVNALLGLDPKGRSLTEIWRVQDRHDIATLACAAMDGAQPVVAGAIAGPIGEEPVHLELLLLPLRYGGRTHARLLGALSCSTVPNWLGLLPVAPLTLASHRIVDPYLPEFDPPRSSIAMASIGTRYGNLVIYDGGRP